MSNASPSDPTPDAGACAGVDASAFAQPDAAAGDGGSAPARAAALIGAPGELAAAREARGWTVADVASKLGMMPRQIEALERGDWDALPGQAFVRGAIRACGKVLQADVEPLLASVGGTVRAAELRPAARLDAPLPRRGALGFDNGGSGSRLTWLLLAVLGVIAIAMYFGRGAEWSRVLEGEPTGRAAPGRSIEAVPVQAPPVSAASQGVGAPGGPVSGGAAEPAAPSTPASTITPASTAPGSATAPAPTTAPVPSAASGSAAAGIVAATASSVPAQAAADASARAAVPASPSTVEGVLHFRFEREAWVEVRDAGGKLLLHGMQPAGSERQVAGRRPYSLTVGNATHVRLEHGGREIDLGAIARRDVARLKID